MEMTTTKERPTPSGVGETQKRLEAAKEAIKAARNKLLWATEDEVCSSIRYEAAVELRGFDQAHLLCREYQSLKLYEAYEVIDSLSKSKAQALDDLQRAEERLAELRAGIDVELSDAYQSLQEDYNALQQKLAKYDSGAHVMVPREVSKEMLAEILTESDLRWQANAERYYKVLWAKMIEAAQQQEKE